MGNGTKRCQVKYIIRLELADYLIDFFGIEQIALMKSNCIQDRIPVLNKIDMDNAMIDEVKDQIVELIGCEHEEIIEASAKIGLFCFLQELDLLSLQLW